MVSKRFFCYFSSFTIVFQIFSQMFLPKTQSVEWNDRFTHQTLKLYWFPGAYLYNKPSVLLEKQTSQGKYFTLISMALFNQWKSNTLSSDKFMQTVQHEYEEGTKSCFAFLISQRLRSLEGLRTAFEGYRNNTSIFQEFFNNITLMQKKLDSKKKHYKNTFPRKAALATYHTLASYSCKKKVLKN